MTRNGALAGIIVGAVTVLVWKQFGWLGLYEIVPGFILCGLTVFVVSRLGQPSPTMLAAHAAVEEDCRHRPSLKRHCWLRQRPGVCALGRFCQGAGHVGRLRRPRDRWRYRLHLSLNPALAEEECEGIPYVVTNE